MRRQIFCVYMENLPVCKLHFRRKELFYRRFLPIPIVFYHFEIPRLFLLFWPNFAKKSRRFCCIFCRTVILAVFLPFKKARQTFWDRIIFKNQIFGGPYWISRSYVLSKISADLFCASSRPFDDYCFIWNISKIEYAKPFSVLWVFHMKQSKGPPHITKKQARISFSICFTWNTAFSEDVPYETF